MYEGVVTFGKSHHQSFAICFKDKYMPSPSAFSKFVLSVLKFLGLLKILSYTQNILGKYTQMSQFIAYA